MPADIKPANILFSRDGRIRLCDFEVSGLLSANSVAQTPISTSCYISPERITGQSYTITAEVWSSGLTLLKLAQESFLFGNGSRGESSIDLLTKIVRHPVPKLCDKPGKQIKWSYDIKYSIACW
jgi:mitogen-activated protein kinase kinase